MIELLTLLLVFMIVAAVVALTTKDLLSAVIAVGAVGFGSSVAFLLLRAPDVAITQIVVEVLTLVILIRATVGRGVRVVAGTRDVLTMGVTATLLVIFLVLGVMALSASPDFGTAVMDRVTGSPSQAYLSVGLKRTGAANIVVAVLLDFRAYDTLGEATVLFTGIIGAVVVLRRRSRTEEERGRASEVKSAESEA